MLIGLVLVLLVLVVFLVPKPSDRTPQIEQSRMDSPQGKIGMDARTAPMQRWLWREFGFFEQGADGESC